MRVDVPDGQTPWGICGLDVLQVGDDLAGGVGVVVVWRRFRWVWGRRRGNGVAVSALEVESDYVRGTVPGESVGGSVAGTAGDGDVPLAVVRRGIAGCAKELAEGWKCRIENRQIGIGEDGADEPALMGVEAGEDGAASWRASASSSVIVGEFYTALPDVFVEVGHKAPEVFFGAIDAGGKDAGPTQFIDEDKEDVGFRSWFGDVLRETKATCDSGARGGDSGGFQEVSAFHCLFSNNDEIRCC